MERMVNAGKWRLRIAARSPNVGVMVKAGEIDKFVPVNPSAFAGLIQS